jgi:uncharacterized paraquat-inducible protein A
MRLNKASRPLGLPVKAPPCFESQKLWSEYRRLAYYTADDGWTFCSDCTAAYQAKMCAQGRCKYPRVVFVANTKGEVTGRRP